MGKDVGESGAAGIVDIGMDGIGVARGPAIKCGYVPAYWWEASRQRRRGRPSLRLGQSLRRHLFSFQLRTTKVRRISATRRPSWFVALVSCTMNVSAPPFFSKLSVTIVPRPI